MDDRFDISTLFEAYREEATEQLNLLDRALLRIEESGSLPEEERLELLRVLHTFKGNSAMVGIREVADRVHALETVFKAGEPTGGREQLDALFELSAILRSTVDRLGTPEQESAVQRLAAFDLDRLSDVGGEGRSPTKSEKPADQEDVEGEADEEAAKPPEGEAEQTPKPQFTPATAELVRVPFAKLDRLLAQVGEMVGFHAQLESFLERNRDKLMRAGLYQELDQAAESLALRTDALRETTMSLRLVPLKTVFGPFPGLVREIARAQDKRARLEIEGSDIELDKTAADALAEPLLHLVRNAVDHGLETPEERKRAGKDEIGTVGLRAQREGDHIRIEISDDGAGLDRAAILRRARDAGLIQGDADLTPAEIRDLIFRPGFSTRTEASAVSGRGMGLDIVRRGIVRLRGSLEVELNPGGGTSFILNFPLTLAIVPALIFESGGETMALPAAEVRETLPRTRPEFVGGTEVVRHREGLVPIARPERIFGWARDGGARGNGESAEPDPPFAIVLGKGGRTAAVIAERLVDQRDVVVKALPSYLGPLRGLSGATVAPDGTVILLLDSQGVLDLNMQRQRGSSRAE